VLLDRLVRRGGAELFGKKFIILVVVTDPIPEERVAFEDGEGSIAGGSARYADQKSVVVDDFAKRLCPSLGDIAAYAIEDPLHPTARLGIPGDLLIPRINLAEFEVGKPSQKFLPLAQRKRLHLLGDLLHPGHHNEIIA
jgi:hypothetical protein